MQPLTHLALRVSDKLYNVPSAIHRHIQVSCRHGAVWLGKPDRGLPKNLVDTLNHQIEAGYPAYLFLIDPDSCNQVMYLSELQGVSLKSPPEKELVPGFYREMKMLSRMKAWLKIGDLEGYRLDEHPVIEAMNRHYTRMEEEALRQGSRRLPGYFKLKQERV
jgi:hypothetical protein